MLQIKDITKRYVTGELLQTALDGVSLTFRDSEFVAVLGPSGSGKTTLLNVIGGLDRYDEGNLIINGVSTRRYRDRDWDSYRNHSVGFVFQSYNLIPHQTILANVELALTISGISGSERRSRAVEALEKVGLGNQLHKRPNQLSGGQMQRVAIARALVNDPSILLADEPTGALDSDTSASVMDLLKEVAADRLVVMVTHDAELAERYATRIVRLRDGRITDDSDPYLPEERADAPEVHRNLGHASMSFLTALSLSFNNLRTKMGRTFLTAFAGSIGIIGIALILSLSTGVNNYIADIQKSTMTSYPITIQAQAVDLSSLITAGNSRMLGVSEEPDHALDGVYSNGGVLEMASTVTSSIRENNLTAFKRYLDDPASPIYDYLGENGVVYSYATRFGIYTHDPDGTFVNTDGSTLTESGRGFGGMGGMMGSFPGSSFSGNMNFEELLPGQNGALISAAVTENYELLYGAWPAAYDEAVLILNGDNEISASVLYQLGILPTAEYRELTRKIGEGERVTIETLRWDYADLAAKDFYLIPACDTYLENADGTFTDVSGSVAEMEKLMESALRLKLSGVIRPKEDANYDSIYSAVGYTQALTDYVIEHTNSSAVVRAQEADPDVNVLNGLSFSPADDAAKAADAKAYLTALGVSDKAALFREMMAQFYGGMDMGGQFEAMGETDMAAMLDNYLADPDEDTLLLIYDTYISTGSYEDNMESFGVVSIDAPDAINLYADSFEDKDGIADCIEAYNRTADEADQITYTDYVGLLMSSVTTIINVISYVLIAFVAVSLVVSSIMIGIITYISVLERTKEIGILRAIGASKRNISEVFNAETFIIGLFAGLIGIGVALLLLIPGNAVIHALTGSVTVNAVLPLGSAALLVALSVVLTLIGGIIPSRAAAKKDPVIALRTE